MINFITILCLSNDKIPITTIQQEGVVDINYIQKQKNKKIIKWNYLTSLTWIWILYVFFSMDNECKNKMRDDVILLWVFMSIETISIIVFWFFSTVEILVSGFFCWKCRT